MFTVRRPIEGGLAKSRLSTPPTSHRSRHRQFRQLSSWGIRDGMPREIRREEVRRLIDQGVQLVEVLPAKEYREDHLPGAINLPLRQLETEARSVLDVSRPVIVYCWDTA